MTVLSAVILNNAFNVYHFFPVTVFLFYNFHWVLLYLFIFAFFFPFILICFKSNVTYNVTVTLYGECFKIVTLF